MKNKLIFLLILPLVIFYTKAQSQEFEGRFTTSVTAEDGFRHGDFYFQRTDPPETIKWEYKDFVAKLQNRYWVDDLNTLGEIGWEVVPSIRWGYGMMRALLKRRIINDD